MRVPALFISHGAPLFAVDPGSTGPALAAWAAGLPLRPRAVVVLSPHWMTPDLRVMSTPEPETWHDFGGFPPELYQLQYPAVGSPALAERVLGLLDAAGMAARADASRPFDHGAWVPLMHLFPQADVPVLQLSLPRQAGPKEAWAMGRALQSLRLSAEEGGEQVLLLGSGSMTHNLAEFFGGEPQPSPYVERFARAVEETIERGDAETLLHYRERLPDAVRAHPTEDHFMPLFFALGAAGWGESEEAAIQEGAARPRIHYLSREVRYGMLAMDTLALA